MNIIKNISSNNIKVSIHKKILNIIMIFLLCNGMFFGIPINHTKEFYTEKIIIIVPEEEYQCSDGEKVIEDKTNLSTSDPEFDEWYVKFIEKQNMRKAMNHEKEVKNHERDLEIGGTVIGTILLVNGVIMVNSQMPWMLAGSFGMITPGVLLVGAELILIGSGMVLISMYLFGEDSGNNIEEDH